MAGTSLNDLVTDWAASNAAEATYNAGKAGLQSQYTFAQIMAAGSGSYNEGLMALADVPAVLAQDSVLWLDSQYSVAGEPRVINRGTGGSALDAKYGSVLGAYVYDGVVKFPGLTGNAVSVPAEAALDITGDVELVARVAPDNWILTRQSFIGNFDGMSGSGYELGTNTTDGLSFVFGNGSGVRLDSNATITLAGLSGWQWVKATATFGGGNISVSFYYADDQATEPTSWTQLGTTVATAATAFGAPGAGARLGTRINEGTYFYDGQISRGIIRDGIGGAEVLDVDLADVADYATSFTATTGQTVTVNSTSADTNDPLLLTHTGENYAYFTGAANSELRYTDPASPPTTQPTSWTEFVDFQLNQVGAAQYIVGTSSTHFFVGVSSPGNLDISWRDTTVAAGLRFQGTVPLSVGVRYHLSFTVDLTTPGSRTIDYTLLADGVPFDVGMTKPVDSANGLLLSALNDFLLGAYSAGSASNFNGRIYNWSRSYTGSDVDRSYEFRGTDITDSGATTITLTSGQVATVNRATSGRKTTLVTRPVWLFGTDDYLEVADNALLDFGAGEDLSMVVVFRGFGAESGGLLVKRPNSSLVSAIGYSLYAVSGVYYTRQTDGAVTAVSIGEDFSDGALKVAIATVDSGGDQAIYSGSSLLDNDLTTTASLASSESLYVGAFLTTSSSFFDGEIVAVAVWRRVLTADEIAAINTYYSTGA